MPTNATNDIPTILAEIDSNLRHAESLISGISREQFNWSPEPGRWSMGQNFAHLNIVNGGDLAALAESVASGLARNLKGSGPFRYGFLSRKFVASMEPPVTRKFKAPDYYQPPPQLDLETMVAEYRRINAEVRRLAQSALGLDLASVKTRLPALPAFVQKIIKFPLGARLELLTAHDRRHLLQAEQVKIRLGS